MKLIFVILVISVLSGIDGIGRGEVRFRGRQLPFAGQPNATEQSWSHVNLDKLERKQDDSETLAVENLDDTVVVGNDETPFPESPNSAKQYPGSWNTDTIDEVPQPITTTPYPPQYPPPYRPPQQPQQPQLTQQPYYRPPTYPPQHPQPQPTLPPGCLTARGQFPSQYNCANYLNCWDDVVIEQQCPNDLLFNDVTGLCDFEYNVNCGSRPGATPKPSLPNGTKRCPDPNGRYRSATNCSVFYVCLAGSPIKFNCPRGLVYNDDYGVCDYVYNVDCQGAATPKPESLPRPEQPQQPQQTEKPPQTHRPDPTFPPSAYPDAPWLARASETDAWHQRPVASQSEVETKEETLHNQSNDSVEPDHTETPTILSPWDLMHTVPEELTKVPCENGAVHRLNEACSSVVVCRNKRPQLVQCPQAQTYDRPSDSCQPFTIAKC